MSTESFAGLIPIAKDTPTKRAKRKFSKQAAIALKISKDMALYIADQVETFGADCTQVTNRKDGVNLSDEQKIIILPLAKRLEKSLQTIETLQKEEGDKSD